MRKHALYLPIITTLLVTMTIIHPSGAVPVFARKYKTSCSTCHYAAPKLNAFGRAFYNNGFHYPGGDETYLKEEPVSLGADASKQAFPNVVWPADLPSNSPIAVQLLNWAQINPTASDATSHGNIDFTQQLNVFAAGTIGDDFSGFVSMHVDKDIGLMFWLQYNYKPELKFRAGMLDPTPFDALDMLRLTSTHYNYGSYSVASSDFQFINGGPGFEVNGAGNGPGGRGGWTYRVGVVQGAPLPTSSTNSGSMPGMNMGNTSPTGTISRNDVYASASWKFGGLGEIGGTEGQSSKTGEFYKDNSLRLTPFVYHGSDVLTTRDSTDYRHKFDIVGINAYWFWERFNLNTVYTQRKDSRYKDTELKSASSMVEGDYVLYPWLIGLCRYEWTDTDLSDNNDEPQKNLIPGIDLVLRANTRLTLEYVKRLDTARKTEDQIIVQLALAF